MNPVLAAVVIGELVEWWSSDLTDWSEVSSDGGRSIRAIQLVSLADRANSLGAYDWQA